MTRTKSHITFFEIASTIFLNFLLLSSSALAETWKPQCPVGSSCSAPYQFPLGGGAGGYPVSDQQPCPENATPVYRAYNNEYSLGKDSNHRYLTKPAIMAEMQAKGWVDEGIAFCAPED